MDGMPPGSDDPAWVMETCRLLGNSQALLLANLAQGLALAMGMHPEALATAMESVHIRHRDERVEVLATGMRRTMLATLRATEPLGDLQ